MPHWPWPLAGRVAWLGAVVLALTAAFPDRSGAITVPGSLRLAFVGDTHGYNIVDNPALDGDDLLAGVRPALGKADLFVFNHEGTLIDEDDIRDDCRSFRNQSTFAVPPSFAERIEMEAQTIASLANNHAMDCGAEGLAQTLEAFAAAGILTVGAGPDVDSACQPVEVSLKGVDIAFVSYLFQDPATIIPDIAATTERPGVATMDGCDAEAAIEALADRDLVVVSLHAHWGSSWRYGVSSQHLSAVRDLFGRGADLIVSHGPHFPQGVLLEGDAVAYMSLGDFMFRTDYPLPEEAQQSLFALVEVERSAVARAWLYPVVLSQDGLPVLARQPAAGEILELIDGLSDDFGTDLMVLNGLALVRRSSR